jgi:hypothetical protein
MALVLRSSKTVPLTHQEGDDNLTYLEQLHLDHEAAANPHSQYAFVSSAVEVVTLVAAGVSTVIAADTKNLHRLTVTGDTTIALQASKAAGIVERVNLEVVNGGAHTVGWDAGIYFVGGEPTLQASGADTFTFYTTDGGTSWLGGRMLAGEPLVVGVDVQPYDADTAKVDTAQSWTAQQTFKELKDTVYTITDGEAFEIDPANGSVQVVTLGASRTPLATNFEAGQTVLLGIDDGSAYSITWTSSTFGTGGTSGNGVRWVKSGGAATAPTLATSGYTWILLWKVGSQVYGGEVGQP